MTNQTLLDQCERLVGKPKKEITFAVINNACTYFSGNHSWVLDILNPVRENFSGKLSFVDIAQLEINEAIAKIVRSDVLFILGGEIDYLMTIFIESGFIARIPELLDQMVIVASSAGSIIFGQKISTSFYSRIYNLSNRFQVENYLKILDFALVPHLNSQFLNLDTERICEFKTNIPLYTFSDDSALVIKESAVFFVGSPAIEIFKGKVVNDKVTFLSS